MESEHREARSIPDRPLILTRTEASAVIVTINRAEKQNALDAQTWTALSEALDEADRRPDCRAIVLTGAGRRSFCAGADLAVLRRGDTLRPAPPHADRGFGGLTRHTLTTPVIAAVEGWALGGGFELVLACDLAVAGVSARFGLPEVKHGLLASEGGALRLPHAIPPMIARELLLTGEPIGAERAAALGLLNQVVPDGHAVAAALRLAEQLAHHPERAVAAALRVVRLTDETQTAAGSSLWEVNDAAARALDSNLPRPVGLSGPYPTTRLEECNE